MVDPCYRWRGVGSLLLLIATTVPSSVSSSVGDGRSLSANDGYAKIIWAFYDYTGGGRSPFVELVLQTWRHHNPDFEVRQLYLLFPPPL